MKQPTLYLMLGYPGAGKTTTAEIVAQLTRAVHLASDRIRMDLFPNPQFTPQEHEAVYDAIDTSTKELLADGRDVIYDANLNRYQHRKEKYDICATLNAKPILLWVKTPRDIAKDRAINDSREHLIPQNETATEMFDRIAELIEVPKTGESYIVVDGTKVSEDYIKELLAKPPQ